MNVYIHVPFCRKKCDYCAFYSEAASEKSPLIGAWLDKLERDLVHAGLSEKVHTLYLGGGTPTLPAAPYLKRLYDLLRSVFFFEPDAEISTECNPGTLTEDKAEILAGFINRVSIGVQSFHPEMLKRIGRGSGTPEEARATVHLLRKAGIQNIGLDLINALPGQTLPDCRRDLESALELSPQHISVYNLIVEEGTPIAHRISEKDLPDNSLAADMWQMTGEFLFAHGMPRYEVSNYAAKQFRCRHNWNVWHGEPYFGFGPAACSFDGILRKTEKPSIDQWLENESADEDPLPREKRLREIFIMGMRTADGWPIHSGNYDWTFLLPELKKFENCGWIKIKPDSVFPTESGLRFWDSIAEELI